MARKISHKGARDKGKNFERKIAKALSNNHIDAKRVPMSGALSWLKGDVREYNTIEPHVHECKFQETLCIPDWWRQALVQVIEDEVPVLHFTSSYKPVYTMMRMDDFDVMVESYSRVQSHDYTLHYVPPRKNFWQYIQKHSLTMYGVYRLDLEGEPVIAMTLEQYLMLRRSHVKQLALQIVR